MIIFEKYLKRRQFTVKGCQISNFCKIVDPRIKFGRSLNICVKKGRFSIRSFYKNLVNAGENRTTENVELAFSMGSIFI